MDRISQRSRLRPQAEREDIHPQLPLSAVALFYDPNLPSCPPFYRHTYASTVMPAKAGIQGAPTAPLVLDNRPQRSS